MTQPNENQLTIIPPNQAYPLAELQVMADTLSKSGFLGLTRPDQVLSLMLICRAEGLDPVLALRRYHIVDGKPSMRADAMQGEYESSARGNVIIWHIRDDSEVSATFLKKGQRLTKIELQAATKRAKSRYKLMKLQSLTPKQRDDLVELSCDGELTIIRTMAEAVEKHLNAIYYKGDGQRPGEWKEKPAWKTAQRQMLHARCLVEGVRATDPGLIAGLSEEDEARDIARNEAEIAAVETPEERDARDLEARNEVIAQQERDRFAKAGIDPALSEPMENHHAEVLPPAGESQPEPQTEVISNGAEDAYKNVVCHVGLAGGPLLYVKVGDMPSPKIWESGIKLLKKRPILDDKDKTLLAAFETALKNHIPTTETPSQANEPVTPAPVKPVVDTEGDTGSIPVSAEVMEAAKGHKWQDEKIAFKCKVEGLTLGEVDQREDSIQVFRAIRDKVINKPDIHESIGLTKRFIALFAMAEEQLGFSQTREGLELILEGLAEDCAVTMDGLLEALRKPEVDVLTVEEKAAEISEEMLIYIYQNTAAIRELVKASLTIKPKATPKKPKKK